MASCFCSMSITHVKKIITVYTFDFVENRTKVVMPYGDAKANFPVYTTHQCMVAHHLTLPVSGTDSFYKCMYSRASLLRTPLLRGFGYNAVGSGP